MSIAGSALRIVVAATMLGAPEAIRVRGSPIAFVTLKASAPRVFVTRDARSWREVTPRHMLAEIDDVAFAGAHGWLVTSDCARAKAFLERTFDGGRTWSRQPFWSSSCNTGAGTALNFLGPSVGWATETEPTAPRESLFRTIDG